MGGFMQMFSPFLSLSVGGMIRELSMGLAYVELIIPDNNIITNTDGVEGEKEVLVREISTNYITRVWVDPDTQYLDCMRDPYLPTSKYSGSKQDIFEAWRWRELTRDYLPIALLNK